MSSSANQSADDGIVLFDGVCNLCNGWVDFLLKRDSRKYFRFASLQSAFGRDLLARHGLNPDDMNSVVFIQNGRAYRRSSAAVAIMKSMPGAWPVLGWLVWAIPKPLRELAYMIVARYRYAWFGERSTCRLPTPEERGRFLG